MAITARADGLGGLGGRDGRDGRGGACGAPAPGGRGGSSEETRLAAGDSCWYINQDGSRVCAIIVKAHFDDAIPYYTVRIDGVIRDTERSRLDPLPLADLHPGDRVVIVNASSVSDGAAALLLDWDVHRYLWSLVYDVSGERVKMSPSDLRRIPDPLERTRRRPRAVHGWQDALEICPEKQRVNQRIATLHDAYDLNKHASHAVYLDGSEMHTTAALVDAGWPPSKLHVPNFAERDFLAIQQRAWARFRGQLNVYHRDVTGFVRSVVDLPWAQAFRHTHCGRGPFSLAYLDYTSSEQWPTDVHLLFDRQLLVPGAILAVTCPARAEHVPADQDRHLANEAKHEVQIGGAVVQLDGDLAGQAKLEVALRRYSSHTHSTCLESFAYTSRKTRMWVAIYQISLPAAPQARPSWFYVDHSLFDYEERRQQHGRGDLGTTASNEEERNEGIANMYYHGFDSLEKGPAAMTLEEELREQLTEASVGEVAPRENPPVRQFGYQEAPTRAISMARERQRREERREWDFLVTMYSPADANIFPEIHHLDHEAFAYYKHFYNLDTLRFEGSMLHVDALFSGEPHLRGVGARVWLHGLNRTAYNGHSGRILFEIITEPRPQQANDVRIAVQLDNGEPPIKVRLRNLKYS